MVSIPMSLGEMVEEGLLQIPLPNLPQIPENLKPRETKELHMNQITNLKKALTNMETAAKTENYRLAQEAAKLADQTGLIKHGGPSASIFFTARGGAASVQEMLTAAGHIKDSLDSLQEAR